MIPTSPVVVVTRPLRQASNLQEKLQQQGRTVIVFPLFEIESISNNLELDLAVRNLHQYAVVMFVSPNAIDALFQCVEKKHGKTWQWPEETAAAVVGAASRQSLLLHGVSDTNTRIYCPRNESRTDSETLLAELPLDDLAGKKVLVVRADSGRDFFVDALKKASIEVQTISSYRRVIPFFDKVKQQLLSTFLQSACDWVITSSSVLTTLLAWCEQLDQLELLARGDSQKNICPAVAKMQQQKLYVPHFRIAEVARELGFKQICLTASGDENLILALQSQL
ncbi:uroporphyrinogen-III synthase [Undibacterium sp. FT137W]|uniref:Uroporphyrinogen-III synthase n=2 Tax=Undibacterium fentianense TaxID=2828728 RepID=A0A941E0A5_9BURK|nr:uroporphyrinogen-III synthase [Undibacterium fentianense]